MSSPENSFRKNVLFADSSSLCLIIKTIAMIKIPKSSTTPPQTAPMTALRPRSWGADVAETDEGVDS